MTEALPGRLRVSLSARYAIEREVGQGRMATVYLAGDLIVLQNLFAGSFSGRGRAPQR